jgi:hypothetical protein
MKKNKVTHKFDRHVRSAISLAIESSEAICDITYSVDWSNFPNSLILECKLQDGYKSSNLKQTIIQQDISIKKIQYCFLKQGIKFRDIRKNIEFNASIPPSDIKESHLP